MITMIIKILDLNPKMPPKTGFIQTGKSSLISNLAPFIQIGWSCCEPNTSQVKHTDRAE